MQLNIKIIYEKLNIISTSYANDASGEWAKIFYAL